MMMMTFWTNLLIVYLYVLTSAEVWCYHLIKSIRWFSHYTRITRLHCIKTYCSGIKRCQHSIIHLTLNEKINFQFRTHFSTYYLPPINTFRQVFEFCRSLWNQSKKTLFIDLGPSVHICLELLAFNFTA